MDTWHGGAVGPRHRQGLVATLLRALPVAMVMAASLGVVVTYEVPDWSNDMQHVMAVAFLLLGGVGLFLHMEVQWRRIREARVEADRLLRHRRHDYANHLQVLSGWAQLGDTNRLLSYVKSAASDVAQESVLCRNLPDLAAAELTKLRVVARVGGGHLQLRVREMEDLSETERRSALAGLVALNDFLYGLAAFPTSDWTLQLTVGGMSQGCSSAGAGCPGPLEHCFCARLSGWYGVDPGAAQEVAAGHRSELRGSASARRVLRREDGRDVLVFPLGPRAGAAAVLPVARW